MLLDDIKKLRDGIEDSDGHAYVIKIIVSRGVSERGYQFKKRANENRVTMISALASDYSSLLSGQLLSGDLHICQQHVSINEGLAGIKHLNRLENVLARNEWKNGAADESIIDGLMINANKHVIEATMSNLFAVKDHQLLTPDLKCSGVNGIMREAIIDIAGRLEIKTNIVDMTLDDIDEMDELFITNSLIGMKAVNNIAEKKYPSHVISEAIFEQLLKTKGTHVQIVR